MTHPGKKHYRCIFASWWLLRSLRHTNALHKHKLLFEVTKQPQATVLQTESFRNGYFFSQRHISHSLICTWLITHLSLLAAATVEYCQNPFPAVPWFSVREPFISLPLQCGSLDHGRIHPKAPAAIPSVTTRELVAQPPPCSRTAQSELLRHFCSSA